MSESVETPEETAEKLGRGLSDLRPRHDVRVDAILADRAQIAAWCEEKAREHMAKAERCGGEAQAFRQGEACAFKEVADLLRGAS